MASLKWIAKNSGASSSKNYSRRLRHPYLMMDNEVPLIISIIRRIEIFCRAN
jgi:hypothetical protein